MEQSRRPGGGVTAFSSNGQAMDKQPGQRQRDGQQQPGPQPGGRSPAGSRCPAASDERGQTTIAGLAAGQAAPHGLLANVRDLGLELLEVRRTDETRSM